MNWLKNRDNRFIYTMLWPVVIETTLTTLIDIVSMILVSSVGTEAVAAVGIVGQLNNFMNATFSSVSVGATVVVAQLIGADRNRDAIDAAEQSITAGFLLSVAVALAFIFFRSPILRFFFGNAELLVMEYSSNYLLYSAASIPFFAIYSFMTGIFRGHANSKVPMYVASLMSVSNVILAAILIFGAKMGVQGAGIAMLISRIFTMGVSLFLLFKTNMILKIPLRLNWKTIGAIFNIGFSAGMESIVFQIGKILTQSFVVSFGTIAIAANSIGNSIFSLTNIVGSSMSKVAISITGIKVGEGDVNKTHKTMWKLTVIGVFLLCSNFIFLPVLHPIIGMYTSVPEVSDVVWQLILANILVMPVTWSPSFILASCLRGTGDVWYTTMSSVIGMWLFRVLLGYVFAFPLHMGVMGVWIGMFADWTVRGGLYIWRLQSRRWTKFKIIKEKNE